MIKHLKSVSRLISGAFLVQKCFNVFTCTDEKDNLYTSSCMLLYKRKPPLHFVYAPFKITVLFSVLLNPNIPSVFTQRVSMQITS